VNTGTFSSLFWANPRQPGLLPEIQVVPVSRARFSTKGTTVNTVRLWLLALASLHFAFVAVMSGSAPVAGQTENKGVTYKPFQGPLQKLWTRKTLADISDVTGEPEIGLEARATLEAALDEARKKADTPVMSGAIPVISSGLLFYRSYNGITWVNLHDQKDADGNVDKAGTVQNRTIGFYGSLGEVFADNDRRATLRYWIEKVYVESGCSNLLYENSTVGTLTTDNRYIYAVDDLAVPIPPRYLQDQYWKQASIVHDSVKPLVVQNWLKAFNIATGKYHWQLGADLSKERHKTIDLANVTDYINTHFLCAPISVGGRLYVLNEKNSGDLRLMCLDPETGYQVGSPRLLKTLKGEDRFFHGINRRTNAIRLAYAEGILVCSIHAGEVFGVDLAKHSARWVYTYQPTLGPALEKLTLGRGWKFPGPYIRDGKLVLTTADDDHLHCLDLQDGKMLWKINQEEQDLYVAGIADDKVLVVGKMAIRALALRDGKELWTLEIGECSGLGVLNHAAYLVPVKSGAKSKQPEIAYVDVNQGRLLGTCPLPETPGNLAMHQDQILWQSPTAVTAYGKGKGK
jgi:outer membrane protein assembly factor BamB